MRLLGVFNPELTSDNKLFVDPKLLNGAAREFANGDTDLIEHFRRVVVLCRASHQEGDDAWTTARDQMRFRETSNTALGFSKGSTAGKGIGKVLAGEIVRRAIRILPEVNFDPELLELIGIFGKSISCDRLSDMLVAVLKSSFLAYTSRVTKELGVTRISEYTFRQKTYTCPKFDPKSAPLILVPRAMLKPLPIALDMEQALDNADFGVSARSELNALFAAAARKKRKPGKTQITALLNARPRMYKEILDGYRKAQSEPYDFDEDPQEVSDFQAIGTELAAGTSLSPSGLSPETRVTLAIGETLSHLRSGFESNRLSDCLYDESKNPRNEVIAQRIIFSIAQIFGRMLNVDVTRESNPGVGAIDFRFSVGNRARALLELKLSTHKRLQDGYFEQLPAYGAAEKISDLTFLVLQVDDGAGILRLRNAIESAPPSIVKLEVIDATAKPSASKRKRDTTSS